MNRPNGKKPGAEQASRAGRLVAGAIGYGTVGVVLLVLLFFLVYPVTLIMVKAFVRDGSFSLAYFELLLENSKLLASIKTSLLLGAATTIATTLLSLPLALLCNKYEFRGKSFISGLLLLPMVMPPFVGAIGIQRLFARRGSINLGLMQLGVITQPIDWLGNSHLFWAVVALEVLNLYPIMYLNLTAALANVDPSLDEVATTLGVSHFRKFKDITWPLVRPGYFAGAVIVFIWSLTDLGAPLIVGLNETMAVQVFGMVTDVNENPVGYALVFLVILLAATIFLLSRASVGGKKYEMLARGHVGSRSKGASPLQTMFILLFFGSVVFIAIVPHLSVLLTSLSDQWFMTVLPEQLTLRYYGLVMQNGLSVAGIKNSLFLASCSMLLDLFLGVLVAYVVVRKLVPFSGLLDTLCMVPLALPGIVIAFGFVVAYSDTILDPMINPTFLLVIAYAIRRLPFMVRSASAGLQQTSVVLEEASQTFGASRFTTLRKITVPLVMANLIAGALLCFAYAMIDVSDGMILAMKDRYYPLTKAIYALFLEQGSGEFVASALGMVGMAILVACIMGASLILGKKMGELFRA